MKKEILEIEKCDGLCGIYKINFPNGKSYIGRAVDIKRRIKEHNNPNSTQLVDKIIQKELGKVTQIELLEKIKDKTNLTLINERERYWIKYYNTYEDKTKGYNLTPGGDGAAYGVDNVSAKLNKQQLQEVYDLLLNSDLFIYEIAKKYNISKEAIGEINYGKRYFNPNFNYPLRTKTPKSGIKKGLQNHLTKFNQNDLDEIYDLLINHNEYSLQEIAKMKNVSYATISNINRGIRYAQENYSYPLRSKQKNANFKLSEQQIIEIYNKLKYTKQSQKSIGKEYNVSQDTIIRINKGIYYIHNDWEYPIRRKE